MGYAYIIEEQGGCEALKKIKVKDKTLEAGQARIKQLYLGLSFQDILLRRGDKKVKTPFVPGVEACGIIEEVASDVTNFKIGDRVVYCTAPVGAYVDYRNVKTSYLIKVPEFIAMEEVCGFFSKAIWAHTLMHRVYRVQKGENILVHSAAGGVGSVLTQMLSHIGANIIGTVGDEKKIKFALNNGCKEALVYNTPDFFTKIKELTNNIGVQVVYDPIGKAVLEISLLSLAVYGLFVTYGSVSGVIDKLNVDLLSKKSLFLSAPSFVQYKSSRKELESAAAEIFNLRKNNIIKNNICKIFDFDSIREAHDFLEQRKAMGSVIVKI